MSNASLCKVSGNLSNEDKVMLMKRLVSTLFSSCSLSAKCLYVWDTADTLTQIARSGLGGGPNPLIIVDCNDGNDSQQSVRSRGGEDDPTS